MLVSTQACISLSYIYDCQNDEDEGLAADIVDVAEMVSGEEILNEMDTEVIEADMETDTELPPINHVNSNRLFFYINIVACQGGGVSSKLVINNILCVY